MKNIGGPYDKCLSCPDLGERCDGPNTLAMGLERWCEWCRKLKDLRGMTNAELAEKSGVSPGTINRVMSGQLDDIRHSTASLINRVLVGSGGKWPCAQAVAEETPATLKELELKTSELDGLRHALEEIHNAYAREMDAIRREDQAKIDYLKLENERKDRIIEKLLSK